MSETIKTLLFYLFLNFIPLALGFFCYKLTRRKPLNIKLTHANLLVWVLFFFFATLLSILVALKIESLNGQCDLGLAVNVIWNTLHTAPMASSIVADGSYLANHASIFPIFLIPFWLVFPNHLTVVILQCFVVALGGIAVYQLFRKMIGVNFGVLMAIVYWLSPFTNWIAFSEFHEVAYILTFALFVLVQIAEQRKKLFWVLFILLVLIREDAAILGAMIGIYLFFHRKNRVSGIIAFLIGIAVSFIGLYLIIPYFHQATFKHVARFPGLGSSMHEVFLSPILRPQVFWTNLLNLDKLLYFIQLYMNFAYLPFLAWGGWIVGLPFIYVTLLTSYQLQFSIYSLYGGFLLPGILLGTALGLSNLIKWVRRRNELLVAPIKYGFTAYLLAISLLMAYWFGPLPISWNKNFNLYEYQPTDRTATAKRMIDSIPSSASVYGSDNLSAFYAARSHAGNRTYTSLEDCRAQYVIFDDRFDREHGMDSAPSSEYIKTHYSFIEIRDELYLGVRNEATDDAVKD
jgi:uncharacterized membrane protein